MDAHERISEALRKAGLTSQRCVACEVCCRFASPVAALIPFFDPAEMACALDAARSAACFRAPALGVGERVLVTPAGEACPCPFLREPDHECSIYARRPLDCRLYPFVLMYDEPGAHVWLGADEVCPFVAQALGTAAWQEAVAEVTALLEGPLADKVAGAPGLVASFQESVRPLHVLPELTRRTCGSDLGLARLVVTAREPLEGYFRAWPTGLMSHAFPSVYCWADLFHLHWKVEAGCLLVLAEQGGVSFLMLPPVGDGDPGQALEAARGLMAAVNGARVQEVDEDRLPLLTAAGWEVACQSTEFICWTDQIATLRGRHFDGARHDVRRFETRWQATWRPYRADDFPRAIALLSRWQQERAARHAGDPFYCDQLEATGFLHARALREADPLGLQGYVVEVEGQLAAYTFGFPLADGETFGDFLEVADLSFPGLPTFVFRQFAREVSAWPFLNLGTDSDLPSLRRRKLLFRPCRTVASYVLNAPPRGVERAP